MSALEKKKNDLQSMSVNEIVAHPRIVEMFKKMHGDKAFAAFEREKVFALQAFQNNKYLMETAEKNKMSVYAALINCAINKLSLNPALGLSYLIPRGNAVVWQVSYQGKIEILKNAGAILAVTAAEVVYDCDEFLYNKGQVERHVPKIPRPKDAKKLGAYVITLVPDGNGGSYEKCLFMDITAIMKRKDKAQTKTVWNEWEDEMCKKTVVNQLYKFLPKTEKIIELENEAPGSFVSAFQDDDEIDTQTIDIQPQQVEADV